MKYPVIVVPFLKVSGMALFPFILVGRRIDINDPVLINHEKIHLRQQAELLVLPFYLLYLVNYLLNLAVYRNREQAYLNIIFEREAYRHEADGLYLQSRKWFNWRRYF
ncbi:hypothetical protein [Mucilaginibacter glaciei]|uniref:Uncharacterized protein n=1 Tax=Mucilaginibacter glaciei TaxID=2772109 RepID=A0A926NRA1_9SPHI|nr:hypothetical protein [Mucilaginibacter glaciei]MBD1393572.1 hypothetical protein [Mucilaginibacter glaciei]